MKQTAYFSGSSLRYYGKLISLLQCVTWLVAAFTFVMALASCNKDSVEVPITEKQLLVNFNSATIPISLVDSALVIFKKEGSNTLYLKRFEKSPSSLQVSVEDLPTGNWTAEMYISARSGTDTSKRRYKQVKSFYRNTYTPGPSIDAPAGTLSDAWKPSVVLADAAREVQVIVPLDNTDPYFEIRMNDKSWQSFFIERYANHRTGVGNEYMVIGKWECSSSCYTHDNRILNSNGFAAFSEQVKTKTWNNGEINVKIKGNVPGKELSFLYIYKL